MKNWFIIIKENFKLLIKDKLKYFYLKELHIKKRIKVNYIRDNIDRENSS